MSQVGHALTHGSHVPAHAMGGDMLAKSGARASADLASTPFVWDVAVSPSGAWRILILITGWIIILLPEILTTNSWLLMNHIYIYISFLKSCWMSIQWGFKSLNEVWIFEIRFNLLFIPLSSWVNIFFNLSLYLTQFKYYISDMHIIYILYPCNNIVSYHTDHYQKTRKQWDPHNLHIWLDLLFFFQGNNS